MPNATAHVPGLRGMNLDELAALYGAGDDETRAAVLEECERQDRAARVAPAQDALRRLHAEWYDAAYADYLAAEAACVGYFVRPEYAAEITEPFRLWSAGNDEWAQSRATRELLDWWIDHPRLTFARWQKMRRDAVRIAGEEAASLTETGSWEVPAAWAAETTEVASDGHDSDRAEVDGPPQAGHGRGSAASAVRPERDGQQHAAAEAGRMRHAGPVQRGRVMTGAQSYTPGNYAAAIVTGGKRRIIARDIPALEQAQGLLAATDEAKALEAIGQPLEWAEERPGVLRAGNSACVFLIAEAAPQGGTVAKRDGGTVEKTAAPIPGDQLLDLIRQWLGTYIRFPSAAAQDVVTLWAAHAHCRDESGKLVFRATPRLFLLSSEPGSGKSAVLELLNMLCPEAYGLTLEPTGPGLIKAMKNRETALLDEADILFGKETPAKEAVRSIINGGYTRNGTNLTGYGRENVFGPLAMAGLDVLEKETGEKLKALLTRGFKIRMVKAAKDDRPAKVTRVTEGQAAQLKVWLAAWAAQERDGLAEAEPVMPEELDTRAEQISEPLVAVADAAGGDWPERARQACVELALAAVTVTEEDEEPADAFAEFAATFGADLAGAW